MAKLEDLTPGTLADGISADGPVEVVGVRWHGSTAIDYTHKVLSTGAADRLLYLWMRAG